VSEMMLIAQFCDIMETITTEKGLECLWIICKHSSLMPLGVPSVEFSAVPSGRRSILDSLRIT
jgi:hypothetical protein